MDQNRMTISGFDREILLSTYEYTINFIIQKLDSGLKIHIMRKYFTIHIEGYRISTLVVNRWRIVIAGLICRLADCQPRLKLILRNIHSSYNPNENDILFKIITAKYKH